MYVYCELDPAGTGAGAGAGTGAGAGAGAGGAAAGAAANFVALACSRCSSTIVAVYSP